MAPSSGHLLVPKAVRILKFAAFQTKAFIRSKLTASATTNCNATLQPIPIPIHANAHPIHPLALLRQSRSQCRQFSRYIRQFSSKSRAHVVGRYDRSTFPVSKTSQAIARSGAAPFASTLRPNLTGGTLLRSAGGYSLGGTGFAGRGVRHFSHTSGAQAQVVQNVSAGIRAFLVGGGKARFDGFDRKTGEKQFKVISRTEDEVLREIERPFKAPVKGTNLEFHLSPTITAFSSTFAPSATGVQTLNAPSFLSTLSADFAHALSDLSAVLTDLKKLSTFGDLPVSLANTPLGPIITLRFQGCDADIVSRLCDEAGVRRGIIREDEAWDHDRDVEMALLFPFVSTGTSKGVKEISEDDGICFTREPLTPEQLDWRPMMSPHEFLPSIQSSVSSNPFKSPPSAGYRPPIRSSKSLSGYESLRDSDFADDDPYVHGEGIVTSLAGNQQDGVGSEGYEGLQGVFRFLRECEEARR